MANPFRFILFVASLLSLCSFAQTTPDLNGGSNDPRSQIAARGANVSGFRALDKSEADLASDYADRVLEAVRSKWYPQIAMLHEPAKSQRGTTLVAFEIRGDGSLSKLKVVESSNVHSLDETAKQAIMSSAPFERLPNVSSKEHWKLQMYFGYNKQVSVEAPICDDPNWGAHPPGAGTIYTAGKGGVKPPHASYSPDPEFSEEARKAKFGSAVTVAGTVDEEGAFTDLCVVKAAGIGLDEKATQALRNWRFQPATLAEKPVPVRIVVETTFRIY